MLKIVQFTDLHLPKLGVETQGNIDVWKNFRLMVDDIKKQVFDFDLLVVSGDLCYDEGEKSVYHQIKADLEGIPFTVIPGNHDNKHLMREVFDVPENPFGGDELCFKLDVKGHPIYFVDSGDYTVSQAQLDWLSSELQERNEDTVIFVHHPPMLCGVPFMDNKHPLKNHGELMAVLNQLGAKAHVFCGHYHVDKSLVSDNVKLFVSPSPYFQIDYTKEEFGVDNHLVGYRRIVFDGKTMTTAVRYLS